VVKRGFPSFEGVLGMREEDKTAEEVRMEDKQGATSATYGAEEPWLPIETKLVVRSVIAGIILLIVLATLVNMFLLGGH
jgi:hypothetical protein